jgi:hypothetical protein
MIKKWKLCYIGLTPGTEAFIEKKNIKILNHIIPTLIQFHAKKHV